MGISRFQQSTKQLSSRFDMQWPIHNYIFDQRLRWLGHLGCMDDNSHNRLPKKLLFGELLKKLPFHGVKKKWWDVVISDLHDIDNDWYCLSG